MAYALKAQVGRLIISAIKDPVVADEAGGYIKTIGGAFMKIPGPVVIFCDVSGVTRADPAVAQAYGDTLRAIDSKIERSVLYVSAGSPVALWIYNMVKQNANPARRMFTSAAEGSAWLGEILQPLEKSALQTYTKGLK